MSLENSGAKSVTKEDTRRSSGSSGGGGGRKSAGGSEKAPEQPPLKCPRCDSSNTKFCYYNNYSLSQPRYFCKTCRRYWTKGGALRNVPIGGGCRKNKKIKCSSNSSRISSGGTADDHFGSKDLLSSPDFGLGLGGLKFFNGLPPAMDFQLGSFSSLPRTPPSTGFNLYTQFAPFSEIPNGNISMAAGLDFSAIGSCSSASAAVNTSFLGFSNPGFTPSIQEMNLMNGNTNLASSIESLSSINQELHWKLQQQRLAMLYGASGEDDQTKNHPQVEKPQPILFQNLDISNSRKDGPTEWFFDSSFAPVSATPTNSGSNNNDNTANLNGLHHWSTTTTTTHDLHHQFTGLP